MISPVTKLCALWLAAPAAVQAEPCRSGFFEGASYVVCSFVEPRIEEARTLAMKEAEATPRDPI
jgi:hypothetical protein